IVTLRMEPLADAGEGLRAPEPDPVVEQAPDPTQPDPTQPEREAVRLVLHIDDVIPGGPAARAGLQKGDRILAIEGKPIANFSDLAAAVTIMRGEPGTQVSFSYVRDDQPERTVTVTRA